MSLKAFHIVFCTIVGAFLIGFGVWCVEEYQLTESTNFLAAGFVSIALGLMTPLYMKWFLKKLNGISYIVLLAGVFGSQLLSACPVCISNANDPMVKSANNGVVFLAALTALVLVPFAGTMIYLGVRSYKLAKLGISL